MMSVSDNPGIRIEFTLLSMIRVIWKRRLIILILLVAGILTSALIMYRLPSTFFSEALILVDSEEIPERYLPSVDTDVKDRFAAITQELLSTTHLQSTIDSFGLYRNLKDTRTPQDIVEIMRRDISIKVNREAHDRPISFRVGYQGYDPNVVQKVATKLANFYVEQSGRDRSGRRSASRT